MVRSFCSWSCVCVQFQCMVFARLWKMFLNCASFSIIRNRFFRIDGKLVNQFLRHNLDYKKYKLFGVTIFIYLLSLRLEGEETLKYRVSVGSCAEKFNIVSNDHGRNHKCDCSVFARKFPFCARKCSFWQIW